MRLLTLLLALSCASSPARALPAPADAETLRLRSLELLGPPGGLPDPRQPAGRWAFEFLYLKRGAAPELLSQNDALTAMVPASTMKLFTGWFGFVKGGKAEPLGHVNHAYLSEMLHHSDNDMAQDIIDLSGGPAALTAFLESPAPDGPGLALAGAFTAIDGSGLSDGNRATPDLEVALLGKILNSDSYDAFKVCLAQPGQEGTLEGRLLDMQGRLFGKTGTLQPRRQSIRRRHTRPRILGPAPRGVDALAGFLETKDGVILFSVLGNSIPYAKEEGRRRIDAVVRLHAEAVARREVPPLPRLALPATLRLAAPSF